MSETERKGPTAIITDPQRKKVFEEIFGENCVIPLESFVPKIVNTPAGIGEAYFLDLGAITIEQRRKIVNHLSRSFKIPLEEVDADLEKHGVPILAKDCIVKIPLSYLT